MPTGERKSFASPDEVRSFEKGKAELLKFGDRIVGRYTFQPGWRWSLHVKPIVQTDLCEVPHFGYVVAGRLHNRQADGTELEAGPGDVVLIPPGHDGWVVGDEPTVLIDWTGATGYAKGR